MRVLVTKDNDELSAKEFTQNDRARINPTGFWY